MGAADGRDSTDALAYLASARRDVVDAQLGAAASAWIALWVAAIMVVDRMPGPRGEKALTVDVWCQLVCGETVVRRVGCEIGEDALIEGG